MIYEDLLSWQSMLQADREMAISLWMTNRQADLTDEQQTALEAGVERWVNTLLESDEPDEFDPSDP